MTISNQPKEIDLENITLTEFINLVQEDKELIGDKQSVEFIKIFNKMKKSIQKKRAKPSFKCDQEMKYALHQIEHPKLIALINKLCKTNFSLKSKVTILKNEHMKITGTLTKGYVVGDFAVEIQDPNDKTAETVVIEFQSSSDKDIPFRIYVYGFNAAQLVKMDIKSIREGEVELQNADVLIEPYQVILYTTLDEDIDGYKRFHHSKHLFEVNGVKHSKDTNDVYTDVIPYYNLLRMALEDFENDAFDFLQPIALYKYQKYPHLIQCENSTFEADITRVYNNLDKLKGKAKIIAKDAFINVTSDINTILQKDKSKYSKEIEFMEYRQGTYVGYYIQQGIEQGNKDYFEQGIKQGNKNTSLEYIKNMLGDLSDDMISKYTNVPTHEIAQIRAEHT